MRKWLVGLSLALMGLGFNSQASADTVGSYLLTIEGPISTSMHLYNNSDGPGVEITRLHFTIGDVADNFDAVTGIVGPIFQVPPTDPGTATLTQPDGNDVGGLRSDYFEILFTGFDPSKVATWGIDIDADPEQNIGLDFRTVFFNNGSALNSVITVDFLFNGTTLSSILTLADDPSNPLPDSYSFEGSVSFADTQVVPLPPALPLFAGGLGLMGWMARRRRKQAAHA